MVSKVQKRVIRVVIIVVVILQLRYLFVRHYKVNYDSVTQVAEEPNKVPDYPTTSNMELEKDPTLPNSPKKGKPQYNTPEYPITDDDAANDDESKDKSKSQKKPTKGKVEYEPAHPEKYNEVMEQIKSILMKFLSISPGVSQIKPGIRNTDRDILDGLFGNGELNPTTSILSLYSTISQDEIDTLKNTHKEAVQAIPKTFTKNAFTGRGIVMTGGGKYFPITLSAISWIRKYDEKTPIELYLLDDQEDEPDYCSKKLPSLNVECRNIRRIYGDELANKIKSMYALKPLAMLASKFDDILFMDSDSLPLGDVNEVFDWNEFQEKGLILNSDYWYRFIHPAYYEIAGVKLGDRARGDPNSKVLNQHDRKNAVPYLSNESGQIFMKKSAHMRSLLLSVYYNIYGPSVYFPLLMQGSPGMGDKDTYAAAAVILGEDFYQTKHEPNTIGYWRGENDFKGVVMVQPNPINDYAIDVEGKDIPRKYFAMHANYMKANPKHMIGNLDHDVYPELRQRRLMGPLPNALSDTEKDSELRMFVAMRDFVCNWVVKEKLVPKEWAGDDTKLYCKILQKHTEWLTENPKAEGDPNAPSWLSIVESEK